MKKSIALLILVTIIGFLTSSTAFGQNNINKSFIGFWTSDGTVAKTVIFKDKDDNLQFVKWSSQGGDEVEIVKIKIEGNYIKTTEKFISTNWITYNTYSIVDENTLKQVIDGDGGGTIIILKRIK